MDENLLKAYEYGNYAKTIYNQIALLQEKLKKKLKHSCFGGTFNITPEFISYIKAHLDQNVERLVILDDNKVPVMLEDVENFFKGILNQEKLALNWYYEEFNKIKKIRDLKEILNDDIT